MAGGVDDDPNLKGLSRIFNSQTNRGRANITETVSQIYYADYPIGHCARKAPVFLPEIAPSRDMRRMAAEVLVTKATYSLLAVYYVYYKLFKTKKKKTT